MQHSLFKKKPPRTYIFITPEDIMELEPKVTTKGQAYRIMRNIIDANDKPRSSKITINTYCEFRGLTPEETIEVKKQLGFKIDSDD